MSAAWPRSWPRSRRVADEGPARNASGTAHARDPVGRPGRDPHHPQGEEDEVPAEGCCPVSPGCRQGADRPDARQPGETPPGCNRQRALATVPEPGVLRPMARALLSVAAEVQAARCDPLGAGRRPAAGGLRMGNQGLHQGVHSPGRSVVLSPATPERTGSGVASSQVRHPAPPPVVNPDSMGDCA